MVIPVAPSETISVLYVDDAPGLLDLAKIYLEKNDGFRVTTCEDALRALDLMTTEDFDVIVSDYQMPNLDGIQFLKRIRAKDSNKPFIIFTGKGREEVVIDALNNGADFYIQKGGHAKPQFAELAANIRYAHQRRWTEKAMMRQSKAMEASIDGIAILDDAFHHVYANQSYSQIFGYDSLDEINLVDFKDLFYDQEGRLSIVLQSSPMDRGRFQGQISGLKKDGTEIPLDMSMTALDDGGSVVVIRDITELVEAETDIKRQSENISIVNEVITYANQASDLQSLMSSTLSSTLSFLGFRSGGIYLLSDDQHSAVLEHHVNLPRSFLAFVKTVHDDIPLFQSIFVKGRMVVVDKDSPNEGLPTGPFQTLVFIPITSRTKTSGAFVVASDELRIISELEKQALRSIGRELGAAIGRITSEIESERTRTNLQTLFDGMDEMVFIMDSQCLILETNQSATRHLGYSQDELKHRFLTSLMPPEMLQDAQELLNMILTGEKTLCDIPLVSSHGEVLNVETNMSLANWNGSQVLVGVARDVGPRIRFENALRESEKFIQTLMDSTPAHIFLYDDKGEILYLNRFAAEELGYDLDELMGKDILSLVPEDDQEKALGYHRLQKTGKSVENYDINILRKDGERRTVNVSSRRMGYKGKESNLVVLNDVTDLRRTTEEWQRSDDLYQLISKYTSDVIWMMDFQGRFKYVSPSVQQLRGFTPDEVMAQRLEETITPASMDVVKPAIMEGLKMVSEGKSAGPFRIEIEQPRKDGSTVWTEAVIQTSLDKAGMPNGFIGVSRNIELRRETEDRMRESEERHRLLIENSHDIIFMLDIQGVFLFVSPSWTELLGHDTADVIGKPFPLFVHPDDVERCFIFLNDILETGKRKDGVEYRVLHLNGEYRWHTSSGAVIRDSDGNAIGIEGIARDITEKKMAERVMSDSRDKFRALFIDSPISIMIMDTDRLELIDANKAALDYYGASSLQELQDHPLWGEPPYSIEEAREWSKKAFNEGPQRFEWRSTRMNGDVYWELVDIDTMTLDGVTRLIVTSVDITEQKRYNEALKLANKKLQLLSSITRHDINNQLAVVLGYIELLQSSVGTDRCHEFMEKIGKAADTIERHIRFTKEYEMLGVQAPIWHEVSSLLELDTDVQIVNECQGLSVHADTMLSRVFENLLDNSIRHGEGVTCIIVSYAIDGKQCHLYWQDDGIGIPADMKERIFLRGVGKNTGFGLFLSREILEITGIKIIEEGVLGTGAKFRMTIPEGEWKLQP